MRPRRCRARTIALVLAALLAGRVASRPTHAAADEPPVPEPPAGAVASIVPAEALKHVTYLTGDKLEGRGSGFEGANLAARYLVEQLKAFGVEPGGPVLPAGGAPSTTTGPARAYEQPFDVRCVPFPGQGAGDEAKGQVAPTMNVCGIVRGTDEKLRDEYVLLSAHYDHVGKMKKKVFRGADDNASGTSALLEVAQAFALKDAPRPRRSIFLIWVSAEERGLLGSKHFSENPTVPLAQIVCDLNIDMVGRNKPREMDVYGNGTSPELDEAHLAAAVKSGFKFTARTGSIFLRSDQVNFYEKNIPCLFWTSGLHKDYHTPGDVAAKIDEGKVARVAHHAYLTAWTIANRTERPSFRKLDKNASSGPLGAVLDMVSPEDVPQAKLEPGQGLCLVRSVMDGTPAGEAKLQPGDHILAVGDAPLPEDDPVGAVEKAMAAAKGGKESLRVLRAGKFLRVVVKL
ncbi:MAG: M28 family peptidase [Planctomycetes bacterium]|nr:M28 family peptidase [Planctomycetota bacterium]